MVHKYSTKPCEIEAIQYTGEKENISEILKFGYPYVYLDANEEVCMKTLEGTMHASIGDYIIKGLLGEYYPCKSEAFNNKYFLIE